MEVPPLCFPTFVLFLFPSPWELPLRPAAASLITYPAPRLPTYPQQILVPGVDAAVLSSLSEGSLGSSIAGRAALIDARQYLGGMEGPVPPPLAAPVWDSFCNPR